MKIGVLCYWHYGGSAAVASALGRSLAQRGHEIHFISTGIPFRLKAYHPNIFLHHPGNYQSPVFTDHPSFLLQVNKIIEVVQTYDLDLLHAHYAVPHCLSAVLSRQVLKRDLPVITTLHGTDVTLVGRHKDYFHITKFGLENSDIITAVSHSLASETSEVFRLRREPEVIYNFIDTDEYSRCCNQQLRRQYAGENEKIIIHISNFRPVKKVKDVIEIFYRITKRVPSRLLLVGDGPDMPAVKDMIKKMELLDKVNILGYQEEISALLSIADLMLLPSRQESFGLAAAEAMACGVPVVASNTGGLPEVVPEGIGGFLADVGDIETMAALAVKILKDNALHVYLSVSGRNYVKKKFSPRIWVKKYEEIYSSLVNSRK